MARPYKEGLDYFPHDTDAASDEKIEALRSLYGNDGYAFYFILLERIYRSAAQELDLSADETLQILAHKVGVSPQKFRRMLATALKWGCFDAALYAEKARLSSNGIKKRSAVVLDKREKMRRARQGKSEPRGASIQQEEKPAPAPPLEEIPQETTQDRAVQTTAQTPAQTTQQTGPQTSQSTGKKSTEKNSTAKNHHAEEAIPRADRIDPTKPHSQSQPNSYNRAPSQLQSRSQSHKHIPNPDPAGCFRQFVSSSPR